MIGEAYCSYKVSKLLKEKGFDELCSWFYNSKGQQRHIELAAKKRNSMLSVDSYSMPTMQMALAWLREVHGIIITIDYNDDEDCEENERYGFSVYAPHRNVDLATYTTFEEACEKALLYTLLNLI